MCKAGKLHHEEGVAEGPCRRDELTKFQEFLGVEDGQERQVFVFAHNMHRFDRMFIQDTLYGQGCRLEKILSRG